MTAQIEDRVLYGAQASKKKFSIAAVKGSGLFSPQDWGVTPVAMHTACVRGYHCTYEVCEGLLLLRKLNIRFDEKTMAEVVKGKGPKIFGKVPRTYTVHVVGWDVHTDQEFEEDEVASDCVLDKLREVMPFTGTLVLGSSLLRGMYSRMGFQKPHHFKVVHELVFENGKLLLATDRSAEVAEARRKLKERQSTPAAKARRKRDIEWVLKSFDRSDDSLE